MAGFTDTAQRPMNITTGNGIQLAHIDQGAATGLPWGTTSIQLPGISAQQMAPAIWGAGYQNNGQYNQATINAMVNGTPNAAGQMVSGQFGAAWQQLGAQEDYTQASYGLQQQGFAQQGAYINASFANQQAQFNLGNQYQAQQFGFQQQGLNLQSSQFYQNMGITQGSIHFTSSYHSTGMGFPGTATAGTVRMAAAIFWGRCSVYDWTPTSCCNA